MNRKIKRAIRYLCAAALILGAGLPASAQIIAEGWVTAEQTVIERAAMGGTITAVEIQAGSVVAPGDSLAQLALTPCYAPFDGTVEAVFAQPGTSADDACARYPGVVSLRPESLYTAYATSEYAYDSVRTGRISVGQTVYMACTVNGTHRGVGRIIGIDGEIFTIEALGGEFYPGETVYVYMEEDCDYADRIGKATVMPTAVSSIAAAGEIAGMYVQPGDFVEKGQLLFETAGTPDENGAFGPLAAANAGHVLRVFVGDGDAIEKGDPIAEICPAENLVLVVTVGESDISAVKVGAAVTAGFDLPGGRVRLTGVVASISYLPAETPPTAYEVRVVLESDPRLTPGMRADAAIETC